MKQFAVETQTGSSDLSQLMRTYLQQHPIGNKMAEETKNRLADYLADKYGADIYSLLVYALSQAASSHAGIEGAFTFSEFNEVIHVLLNIDHQQMETMLTINLDAWYSDVLKAQYHSFIVPISFFIDDHNAAALIGVRSI